MSDLAVDFVESASASPSKAAPRSILKTPLKAEERRQAAQAALLEALPGHAGSPIELKVLVLGPDGCGKSSIIRAAGGLPYAHAHAPTVGVETSSVLAASLHGRPVFVRFWEVPMSVLMEAEGVARARGRAARRGKRGRREVEGVRSQPSPSPLSRTLSRLSSVSSIGVGSVDEEDEEEECKLPCALDVILSGTHAALLVFDARAGGGGGGLEALDAARDILQRYVVRPRGLHGSTGDGSTHLPMLLLAHKADLPALAVVSNPALSAHEEKAESIVRDLGVTVLSTPGRGARGVLSELNAGVATLGRGLSQGITTGLNGIVQVGSVVGYTVLTVGTSVVNTVGDLGSSVGHFLTGGGGLVVADGGSARGRPARGSAAPISRGTLLSHVLAPRMVPSWGYVPPSGGDALIALLSVRLACGLDAPDLQAYAIAAGFTSWYWTSALPSLAWAAVSVRAIAGGPGMGAGGRTGKIAAGGGRGAPTSLQSPAAPSAPRSRSVFSSGLFGGREASAKGEGEEGEGGDEEGGGAADGAGVKPRGRPAAFVPPPSLPSLPTLPATAHGLVLDASAVPAASITALLITLVDDCLEAWGHIDACDDARLPYVLPRLAEAAQPAVAAPSEGGQGGEAAV
jgi:hypothetical protein